MSLDGFIAGPHDEMDWIAEYAGPNRVAEEVVNMLGAVVAGGRAFRLGEIYLGETTDMLPCGGEVKVSVCFSAMAFACSANPFLGTSSRKGCRWSSRLR